MNDKINSKVTFEFNLEDPSSTKDAKRCLKSTDMALALFTLRDNFLSLEDEHLLEMFNGVLDQYNIIIDDIIE